MEGGCVVLDRGGFGAQSIARAAAVLRLVTERGFSGLSLAEAVRGSGLPKPTCRRLLLALIEAGLIEQDAESRRYFLGRASRDLGRAAGAPETIRASAEASVARLARESGDAAFLQVRRGFSVVCVRRRDGDYPLRSHVLEAGDQHPLGAGAGALAILAALDDAEAEEARAANRRLLAERYPSLSGPVMRSLVEETRRQGYSMNRGLIFPGSWGMGMAVRDGDGRVSACLSLSAVESRMQPDREPLLAALLRDEVARLEAKLARPGAEASLFEGEAIS